MAKFLSMLCLGVGLMSGCQSQDHGNSSQAEQIRAQKIRLKQLNAELEKANKDLAEQKEAAHEVAQWLNLEKSHWDKNRESRELQLLELTKKVTEETALLEKTKATYQDLTAKIEIAKGALSESIESLDGQKDLAQQKVQLEAEQTRLKDLETHLNTLKENIEKMSQDVTERQKKLQLDIVATRELFAKEGLGDALSTIEENLVAPFLITVVGQGRVELRKILAQKIMAANENGKTQYSIRALGQGKNSGADDQYLIYSTASKVQQLRNSLNQLMSQKNKEGMSIDETSLFVIARPIQNLRASLKISVWGRKSLSAQNLPPELFAEMTLPTTDIKWNNTSGLDLNQPSTYVLNRDLKDSCFSVDSKCIDSLRKLQWLEVPYTLTTKAGDKTISSQVTARQLLAELLKASIDQMAQAQVKLEKEKQPWLEISQDETQSILDRIELHFNPDDLAKSILPIDSHNMISEIKMTYVIKMVEPIGTAGNSLDSFRYLFNGFVGNSKLVSNRKSRDEIEIELPIIDRHLSASQTQFPDLTLSDWKFNRPAPIAPKNDTSKWYKDSPAKNKYDSDLAAWESQQKIERITELMKRLTITADIQTQILEQLN